MIRNGGRWLGLPILLASLLGLTCLGQTIELPRIMPAFNQAYNEGPDAWGNCPLGTIGCPDQVCTTGCLITAFSSVLAYYEVSVTVPARSSCTGEERTGMDPGIFNDWLREVGGYGRCSQDPVGNCCLIWEQLPAELEITTHVNRSDVGLNPVASVVIDHALRQGHPVIAGVHWGAFCNGGSTQSEDCHWVIITGKRDDAYIIVDPFNPDPASPNGIRTTLGSGVRGSYIIDRFVVVAGRSSADVALTLRRVPQQATYRSGDRIRLTLAAPGSSATFAPFARATMPSGQVAYATLDEASGTIRFSSARESLVPAPRPLNSEWIWYDRTSTESDIGRWIWEVWVERPDDPGTKLGQETFAYEVQPAGSSTSIGAAVIGIVLVIAVAAIAIISTLSNGLE
ncbi:hypothetical protein ACFLSG_00200 [Candidatus Bipolaricaulota bacterium]